jgi:putative ABC transport system permease protein
MRAITTLRLRLRSLFRGSQVERELDEELAYHVARLADEYVASGLSAEAARAAALREMGPLEPRKEECRDARGIALVDGLARDSADAWRALRKRRGFSAVAIATLAIGIGASTAIFSIVDGVLLRPLAYRDPQRLVVVRGVIAQVAHLYPTLPSNAGQFLQWQQRSTAFDALAALKPVTFTMTTGDEPRLVEGARVSPTLLQTLGVDLHAGRFFREDENTPGRDDVVVLGYEFASQQVGQAGDATGRTVTLDGRRYTVIGILPPSFRFPSGDQLGGLIHLPGRMDVMKPLALTNREATSFGEYDYAVIGRLRDGVSIDQARAEVGGIQKRIAATVPAKIDLDVSMIAMQELVVGPVRPGLLLALAAVGVVLLIGCINLAALAFARASSRLRECAVRVALGATRARLMRQLLIESLLLAGIGGALGLVLGRVMLDALVGSAPVALPRLDEVRLDWRVAAFSIAITAVTGAVVGAWPAWRLSRVDPHGALQASSRSASEGRAAPRMRGVLIASEVAFTMTLLAVAGLLVNSLVQLVRVDTGFDVSHVSATEVTLSIARYPNPGARSRFYEELLAEVARVPGVVAAAIGSRHPLSGESSLNTISRHDDTRPELERPTANYRFVSPSYFAAMGMPLVAGRTFDARDVGRRVALVSERTASALWPGEPAVGRHFTQGADTPPTEVIGIVRTSREVGLVNVPPFMVYEPYSNRSPMVGSVIVRTSAPPAQVAPLVRAAIARVDPQVPIGPIEPMGDLVSAALAPRRFQTLLVAGFAAAALLLSCIGIYGTLAYAMSRRSRELAIRTALGAQPRALVRRAVADGLKPVGVGLAVGIAGALSIGKGLSSLLFGVDPRDPATILTAGGLLAAVAALACYVPAARAARIDPTEALRSE